MVVFIGVVIVIVLVELAVMLVSTGCNGGDRREEVDGGAAHCVGQAFTQLLGA